MDDGAAGVNGVGTQESDAPSTGRMRRPAELTRVIKFRATPEFEEFLTALAASMGVSNSEVMRGAVEVQCRNILNENYSRQQFTWV